MQVAEIDDRLDSAAGSVERETLMTQRIQVVGAMLAAVAVLALAAFDRRLRSRGDIERVIDAPVLGVVPSPSSPQQIEHSAWIRIGARTRLDRDDFYRLAKINA